MNNLNYFQINFMNYFHFHELYEHLKKLNLVNAKIRYYLQ